MNDTHSDKTKSIPCLQHSIEGEYQSLSKKKNFSLLIKRTLGFKRQRMLRRNLNSLLEFRAKIRGINEIPNSADKNISRPFLKSGDWVRVLSEQEIKKTLNHVSELNGCSFIQEMAQFCNTTQQVLKPVERLVDERDLRVLRPKGVVILVGVTCQGGEFWGVCDRECYYFWREEWLEKIDKQPT